MYLLFIQWNWITIKVFILIIFILNGPRRGRKPGVGLVSGMAELEENPCISRLVQSKPVLFQSQL